MSKTNEIMPFFSNMDGPKDYHLSQTYDVILSEISYDVTCM